MVEINNGIYAPVVKLMELHSGRKHEEAKAVADGILELATSSAQVHLKGIAAFTMGMRLHVQSDFKGAIKHFENGYLHSGQDTDVASINHLGAAFSLRSLGNLDEAVNHLFTAVEQLNHQGPLKSFLMYMHMQLGEIHVTINEFDIALDFFNKVLNFPGDLWKNKPLLYNSIGNCYHGMKRFDESKAYLLKAIHSPDISSSLLSKAQNDLGILYIDFNELSLAEEILKECIETRENLKMEDAANTSMCYLALTYLKQNKISASIELLNQCLVVSRKYNTKWKELKILDLLAKAYSANQEFKKAIEYYEQYTLLQNEVKAEQEKNILKLKNEQIEKQRIIIKEKHEQLAATLDEIKKLKINRKAVFFSLFTVILLVLVSEVFLDPFIDNNSYNTAISLFVKICIALLFKPLDGMYESILWNRTMKKIK